MPSPAERFAAAKARTAAQRTELHTFAQTLGFELDDFQLRAGRALEAGSSVLVAAPTGAGKTVVGELAVHLALTAGRKAFYTTPIKALSNQKHAELSARFGAEKVGLLTGDTSVNGDAPVVVMTTEVLRNMLYADSPALVGLGHVVMDEVHYLADRARGAVWEEVIIHLPSEVLITSLSATVSNAEEFGAWLATVRGTTEVVVSEHRPVPLWQHVMVGTRMVDLFVDESTAQDESHASGGAVLAARGTAPAATSPGRRGDDGREDDRGRGPRDRGGRGRGPSRRGSGRGDGGEGSPASELGVNPELVAISRADARHDKLARTPRGGGRGGRGRPAPGRNPRHGGGARAGGTPTASRAEVLERLAGADLLPVITFVFSRAGCAAAVRQCVSWGVRLTTESERATIRALVEARSTEIPDADLEVLGYYEWLEGLTRGIAAHHAGMLPAFKEVVEELFSLGLVKAVFATETLALGINMPARSVVLEKLEKFYGENHVDITPGEYTQLTGRAGRRGIDVEGHAVVLWQGGLDAEAVAGLASTRTYPLRSSFRPTYNMAVNLVAQVGRARAREVLETSFAQFQADRGVVGLARQLKGQQEALAGYAESMRCHLGDFAEYAAIRRRISDLEKDTSRAAARARRSAAVTAMEALVVGDVIEVPGGKRPTRALVLDPGLTAGLEGPRPTVLTADRVVKRLTVVDLPRPVTPLARVAVPRGFDRRDTAARRDLAAAMTSAPTTASGSTSGEGSPTSAGRGTPPGRRGGRSADESTSPALDEVARLRRRMRQHPCHSCPQREDHARWAERWSALEVGARETSARIEGRTGTIARTFDRVCDLLVGLGYLEVEEPGSPAESDAEASPAAPPTRGSALRVTGAGQRLRRVYAEKDLLVAQCLRRGLWDDLDPAGLATVLSTIVYEARREEGPLATRSPGGRAVGEALEATSATWAELGELERVHHLPSTHEPDPGLTWPIHRWCRGQSLDAVLEAGPTDLAAGDFVRWCRQLLDLLDQVVVVSSAGGDVELARTARAAAALVDRGVVAYSAGTARAAG